MPFTSALCPGLPPSRMDKVASIHRLNPELRTVQTKHLRRCFMTMLPPVVRGECQMVSCFSAAQLSATGFSSEPSSGECALLARDVALEAPCCDALVKSPPRLAPRSGCAQHPR